MCNIYTYNICDTCKYNVYKCNIFAVRVYLLKKDSSHKEIRPITKDPLQKTHYKIPIRKRPITKDPLQVDSFKKYILHEDPINMS